VTRDDRRGNQNQEKRRQENADRGHQGAPEPRHQIADERRGDHHRTRADHADRNGDEKFALLQPAVFGNEALLQKRNDDQAATEGQRVGLEEE
jgi:hypothetical protein